MLKNELIGLLVKEGKEYGIIKNDIEIGIYVAYLGYESDLLDFGYTKKELSQAIPFDFDF